MADIQRFSKRSIIWCITLIISILYKSTIVNANPFYHFYAN